MSSEPYSSLSNSPVPIGNQGNSLKVNASEAPIQEIIGFLMRFLEVDAPEIWSENETVLRGLAWLINYFTSKNFNVRLLTGYDLDGKIFYNLAFYDITHDEWETIKQDENLQVAMIIGLIPSVGCFEKGWEKDPLKIHVHVLNFE